MSRYSASQARNYIEKSLRAVLDPIPTPKQFAAMRQHFNYRCVYCDAPVPPTVRSGHNDHVQASAAGGSNSIFNFVLACERCNGDQKRELPWREFLNVTVTDPTVRVEREARIAAWLAQAKGMPGHSSDRADAIINEAVSAFTSAVEQLRELRKSGV